MKYPIILKIWDKSIFTTNQLINDICLREWVPVEIKNEYNSLFVFQNNESNEEEIIKLSIAAVAIYILYSIFVNMIFVYFENFLNK